MLHRLVEATGGKRLLRIHTCRASDKNNMARHRVVLYAIRLASQNFCVNIAKEIDKNSPRAVLTLRVHFVRLKR